MSTMGKLVALDSVTNEDAGEGSEAGGPQSGTGFAGDAISTVPSSRRTPTEPTLDSDRFVPRGVLGRGGSSVVIRALDRDIRRDVAVKLLAAEFAEGTPEISRFGEEARIMGQLEHPNIVPVYEFGVDKRGQRFLCMRLIEGRTLEEALHRLGDSRLDPDRLAEFLQVFVKTCDAASFAHSRGIIHRDLKPTNVMISDFGQVYVLDWGIARLVRSDEGPAGLDPPGALIGTACYMAPEQIRGLHGDLDERTDVFALGATLYQILTGQPPLTPEIVRAIWMRRPPPQITPPERLAPEGRVPAELSRIALRALSFDPAARHPSVIELKREVETFQRGSWDLPRSSLPAGTVIVAEGDPGRAAYVILKGHCSAYRVEGDAEVQLRVMGPGDVFGETAVISDKPRSASVKALTDVVLLVVTRDLLSSSLGLNSWMGAFVRALADRFREADERLRVQDSKRAPERTKT
jgi:eukaryotic-like serine/threonine-protein kinase